ncbi:MAG: hypothetical protein AAGD25_01510 [Cyanobacteria bacterium P01_F01_bin.150]
MNKAEFLEKLDKAANLARELVLDQAQYRDHARAQELARELNRTQYRALMLPQKLAQELELDRALARKLGLSWILELALGLDRTREQNRRLIEILEELRPSAQNLRSIAVRRTEI